MAKQLVDIDTIEKDIIIPKGVDYEQSFTITDKNTGTGVSFTGFASCKIDSKFKQNFENVSFAGTFSSTFTNSGVVTLSLTSTQTTSLDAERYVYDLEITQTSSGNVTRVIEGIITVRPQVTT